MKLVGGGWNLVLFPVNANSLPGGWFFGDGYVDVDSLLFCGDDPNTKLGPDPGRLILSFSVVLTGAGGTTLSIVNNANWNVAKECCNCDRTCLAGFGIILVQIWVSFLAL